VYHPYRPLSSIGEGPSAGKEITCCPLIIIVCSNNAAAPVEKLAAETMYHAEKQSSIA
jgi:hypothetical protein